MLKFNNLKIRKQLFVYMILFCTLLLIILWLFQIVFLDSFYKQIKINSIKSSLNKITKDFNEATFPSTAKDLASKNDLIIEAVNSDGRIIFSTSLNSRRDKNYLFEEAKNNNGEVTKFFNENQYDDIFEEKVPQDKKIIPSPPKMENIYSGKIVKNSDGTELLILLSGLIAPVDSTINTLRTQFYIIALFMIIFSFILAAILAKRISDPIVNINESAKKIAQGNYVINCNEQGFHEIKELSETMNYAAMELSKVEKLRKELISNISHDLRTPLTLIKGYAEAIKDLPGENTPENLQIIIDETQRLNSLVTDMLDLSKFQSGSEPLNITKFNITKTIKDIVFTVQELIKNQNYKIYFSFNEDLYAEGDKQKIEQAFYNLLTNGINHTGENKEVYVNQINEDNFIKIEIIDTGKGISEIDSPHIWDRYYKGTSPHNRGIIGTGIGLSIVKSIIDLHQGSCGSKVNDNSGTTFWFKIKKSEM